MTGLWVLSFPLMVSRCLQEPHTSHHILTPCSEAGSRWWYQAASSPSFPLISKQRLFSRTQQLTSHYWPKRGYKVLPRKPRLCIWLSQALQWEEDRKKGLGNDSGLGSKKYLPQLTSSRTPGFEQLDLGEKLLRFSGGRTRDWPAKLRKNLPVWTREERIKTLSLSETENFLMRHHFQVVFQLPISV